MLINYANIKNTLFHLRTFGPAPTFRKIVDYISFHRTYAGWLASHAVSPAELTRQENICFDYHPRISVVVPVYRTPERFLRAMIDSVTAQTYHEWELCIADGSADTDCGYIQDIIMSFQKDYPNIRYTKLNDNLGISGNTNAAMSLATGEYIALLDHDDVLAPNALFEVVRLLNSAPEADVIYTDEDKVNSHNSSHYDPYFKPDFNLDLLRSCNYITHFFVVKKELADSVGGFSTDCDGSQDYDFILKTCERAKDVRHLPLILYHWRTHADSVAGDPESKAYAYDSAVRALQRHMDRCKENAVVSRSAQFGYYQTVYRISGAPMVSIVTENCDAALTEQIRKITTYSNYEFAASPKDASGSYLIMLYQVGQIRTPDWIERLLGNCQRSSIGIVSPKIYYNAKHLLEAGRVYTPDGRVFSPFYSYTDGDTGYCYQLTVQRSCSLIGPYCFMIGKEAYDAYYHLCEGNTPEELIHKLCLLLRKNGLSVIILPEIQVISLLKRPALPSLDETGSFDPFYNPNFSQSKMYQLPK